MRSVVVVLPASMCAMMPMLRVFANGDCLGITRYSGLVARCSSLPPVVGERLVGFRHPVRVLALLDGAAAQVRGDEELVGQLLLHRLAVAPLAGVADQPTDAQREAAVRIDFHRHLLVRAADAA